MTLANAAAGVASWFAIVSFIQTGDVRHIDYACALVLAALVFDVLDGRVARWRPQSSLLGRGLDSLADVISFGVAPARIAYGVGMQGLWDRVVLVFFRRLRGVAAGALQRHRRGALGGRRQG